MNKMILYYHRTVLQHRNQILCRHWEVRPWVLDATALVSVLVSLCAAAQQGKLSSVFSPSVSRFSQRRCRCTFASRIRCTVHTNRRCLVLWERRPAADEAGPGPSMYRESSAAAASCSRGPCARWPLHTSWLRQSVTAVDLYPEAGTHGCRMDRQCAHCHSADDLVLRRTAPGFTSQRSMVHYT